MKAFEHLKIKESCFLNIFRNCVETVKTISLYCYSKAFLKLFEILKVKFY